MLSRTETWKTRVVRLARHLQTSRRVPAIGTGGCPVCACREPQARLAPRREVTPDLDDRSYTGSMSIVFNWNGDDLPDEVRRQMPEELQGLPRGRYVLESVDDAPELTDEDEAGIQAAIDSLRAGRGVPLDAAKARIDRILKK